MLRAAAARVRVSPALPCAPPAPSRSLSHLLLLRRTPLVHRCSKLGALSTARAAEHNPSSFPSVHAVKPSRSDAVPHAAPITAEHRADLANKRQVVRVVLSIVIPLALATTVTGSRSAIASTSSIVLPNAASSAIASTSSIVLPNAASSAIASTSPIVLPNAASSAIASSARDILVSAWMGLVAGCLHTLTGPDHLAALAPLSIGRSWIESISVGALWGCGHDAGQVMFGILFLILKDKLHIEILRTWGARVVGITLLTIGIVGIKEAQDAASSIPLLLAGSANDLYSASSSSGSMRKNVGFATFATGIVHGLQPDALIMILPALALPSRLAGAAFLGMFLLGTVLAMSGYTAFLGSCSHALQKRIPRITEHLSWISSSVAILVGMAILAGELFGLSIL